MGDPEVQMETTRATELVADRGKSTDWFGIIIGAITFLFGIGLLVYTFIQAAYMFSTPASTAVRVEENPNIATISVSFGEVVLRIGLLFVMSIVGSVISTKGVRMYLAARATPKTPEE